MALRKKTYEGLQARVRGFVTGLCLMGFGAFLSTILIVRGDLFSRSLQDTIADLAPWLQGNPTGVGGMGGTVVLGLLTVFCLGYGLYTIGRVFLDSDYTYTIGDSGAG